MAEFEECIYVKQNKKENSSSTSRTLINCCCTTKILCLNNLQQEIVLFPNYRGCSNSSNLFCDNTDNDYFIYGFKKVQNLELPVAHNSFIVLVFWKKYLLSLVFYYKE